MKFITAVTVALCASLVMLSPITGIGQTKSKEKSLRPVYKTQAEGDAYNALATLKDPVQILAATEAFMQTYGTSQLTGEVLGLQMEAYLNVKNSSGAMAPRFKEAIDALERALAFTGKHLETKQKEAVDKNSPELADLNAYAIEKRMLWYRRLTDIAQAANNVLIADFFGKEILRQYPTDFTTLISVARVKAQNPPKNNEEEKTAALAEAELMGQMAVNYVVAFLNSPNSASIPQQDKNEWYYRAHSLMGLIYNQQGNFSDAQKAFRVALKYKKDGPGFYYLAFAYYSEKNFDAAIDAVQKSVFLKGPSENNAKDLLADLYRRTKRSLADFDKDIEAAGQRLGKL